MDRMRLIRRRSGVARAFVIATCLLSALFVSSPAPGQDVDECSIPATAFDELTPITDTLEVLDDVTIGEIEIPTDITHTYVSDIVLELTSPDGTALVLFDMTTFLGDDNMLVTWSDDGVDFNTDSFTCDCLMKPSGGELSTFATESTLGTWSLAVSDEFAGDSGTLESWCVQVTAECEAPVIADLTCDLVDADVELAWTDEEDYDEVSVYRDGELLETLDADADPAYTDEDAPIGFREYEVVAYNEENDCTVDASCTVAVGMICASPDAAISFDLDPTTSAIEVLDTELVEGLEIYLNASHTYVGDIVVTAESPTGTSVTLHDGDLGESSDNIELTFSDDGIDYDSLSLTCRCLMKPEGPGTLADYADAARDGDWVVTITDEFAVDDGTLNEWCLVFLDDLPPAIEFLRGDADSSGTFGAILDALAMLNFSFNSGRELECLEAADADNNGTYSALLDALYVLRYQFSQGPVMEGPFPECGVIDATDTEDLGCETPPDCS